MQSEEEEAAGHKARLRESVARLAAEAGLSLSFSRMREASSHRQVMSSGRHGEDVNKHGGACYCIAWRTDMTAALVGPLRRRFGQCLEPELLRSTLSNSCRQPGEPLGVLANDIESLFGRPYAHMPPYVQSELARDHFLQALSPTDLRIQTQLAHPKTLQEVLEMALERELVWRSATGATQDSYGPAVKHRRVALARRDVHGWRR